MTGAGEDRESDDRRGDCRDAARGTASRRRPRGDARADEGGLTVTIESGAGLAAGFTDAAYVAQGAEIVATAVDVAARADLMLRVRHVAAGDRSRPRRSRSPSAGPDPGRLSRSAERAYDCAGAGRKGRHRLLDGADAAHHPCAEHGRAVVDGDDRRLQGGAARGQHAAAHVPDADDGRGTIKPARVFIIGAGVAGLQAITVARRLGAVVEAYDVRPAAKEQVQSVGARFVELPLEAADAEDKGGYAKAQDESFYRRQREMMAKVVAASDVVITTAAIPGKRSPVLVTADMVAAMAPGSVIVDLAAERGGNCELTKADRGRQRTRRHHLRPDEPAVDRCRITPARCTRGTSRRSSRT